MIYYNICNERRNADQNFLGGFMYEKKELEKTGFISFDGYDCHARHDTGAGGRLAGHKGN